MNVYIELKFPFLGRILFFSFFLVKWEFPEFDKADPDKYNEMIEKSKKNKIPSRNVEKDEKGK